MNDYEELEHMGLQIAPHDPQNGELNVSTFMGVPIALFE